MAGCNGGVTNQRRVTLQRVNESNTADAAGHTDYDNNASWLDVCGRWAKIKTRGGKEFFLFRQVNAEVSHIVDFDYDSKTKDIKPSWRIRYGDQPRLLNIKAAYDVDEAHKTIRCECTEEVS